MQFSGQKYESHPTFCRRHDYVPKASTYDETETTSGLQCVSASQDHTPPVQSFARVVPNELSQGND